MNKLFAILSCVLLLSACGGGGGGSASNPGPGGTNLTVSGTASQGAPITGNVTLKDSKGATKTGSINSTTGAYSIVVDGMTAPFMLKTGNYYSATNTATTTNINPLTHLCVVNAAGTSSPDEVFADPTKLTNLLTNLPTIVTDLKSSMNTLYPSSVSASQRDFMNGSITIDQGVDLLMSKISFNVTSSGFTISFNGMPIVSGTTNSNGTATVSTNSTNMMYAANNMFTSSTTYSLADLQGTWYFFQFIAGSNSGWARGTLTVDSQGNATTTGRVNSEGTIGSLSTFQMTISSSGVIANTDPTSTTRFNLSSDKSIAVGTGGGAGEESLYIMVKGGSGFTQSDLTGDWKFHGLVANSTYRSWQRGDASFASNGASTITNVIKSTGPGSSSNTVALNVASNGIVTAPSGFPIGFYGAITTNKNLLVSTWSNSDGTYAIGLFMKKGLTNASLSDMVGNWNINSIALDQTQSLWTRYLMTLTSTSASFYNKMTNGTSLPDRTSTGSLPISANGIFNGVTDSSYEGMLSLNKNIYIATNTDGVNSNYMRLEIGIR